MRLLPRFMSDISATRSPPTPADAAAEHWRRNLVVCMFGSFTTIVAMTLLLPFLPLYVEQLGVRDPAAIVRWSGAAYGATFFSAALVAPLWGRLADRYGRKLMLIRASLGMAVAMAPIATWHARICGSGGTIRDSWQPRHPTIPPELSAPTPTRLPNTGGATWPCACSAPSPPSWR